VQVREGTGFVEAVQSPCSCQRRNYVIPDDVKFMAVDALAHRVILHIERIMEGRLATAVIRSIVTKTEVPKSFTRENAGGLL